MKKKIDIKNIIFIVASAALYIGIYFAMSNNMMTRSWQSLVLKMCYNIVLAVSLNMIVGFLGDLSLGHAAFYAVGAYSGSFVAINLSNLPLELRFIIGIIAGGIIAAVVGFLISSSILRLKGDYLAIVTLAFGELICALVKIIPGLGGTKGLTGIPNFSSKPKAFLFYFAITVFIVIIINHIIDSRHGRTITAVRDNAIAAESIGINIKKYRVMTFVIAAFFAGIAGVMFAFFKTSTEPGDFTYNVSIEILVMVVLGGMSTFGSIIAACIITALPEVLRGADQYRLLIYAIALITMMLFNSNPKMRELREKLSVKKLINKKKVEKAPDMTAEEEDK